MIHLLRENVISAYFYVQSGYEFTIVPAIKNQQDVEIYDPIEVTPPVLVFPWDPIRKQGYHFPLKVFISLFSNVVQPINYNFLTSVICAVKIFK